MTLNSSPNKLLHNPLSISVAPQNSTAEKVEQQVYQVAKGAKNQPH